MTRLLLIDNFDSFTFNLLHLFGSLPDVKVDVVRNNDDFLESVDLFDGVLISPGPGSPEDKNYFGNCTRVIKEYALAGVPTLGVCLGFQGIALAFGGKLKKARSPMHGKTSNLHLTRDSKLLGSYMEGSSIMRYHSLMLDTDIPLSDELVVTAEVNAFESSVADNGPEVMAFEHVSLPLFGVQFHPESFATEFGAEIAQRFVKVVNSNRGRS
jgi:anthranilate synthase component 2